MARRCFLPFFFFFSCFVTVHSVIYELKGQQVQFDPGITEQPGEILWKHNGNKVVEFNGTAEQVFGSYKGRVTLDRHSAQLQISDLHFEDSGKYESEIYMNRNLFYRSYELKVIEKVPKPTITCQMNSRSSSKVSAVLLCSVELKQSSLNFKWVSKGNVQHGSHLTIFLGGELEEEEYTCRVSNPVSNETATFRAKDCHTDAGLSAGMIALIVLVSIVIVCVGLVILFCRLKHKDSACCTKGQKTDLENPTSSEGAADGNKTEVELNNTEQTPDRKANRQRGLDEKTTQDEEQKLLLEDQPTASSPQPQKQPDTKNDSEKEDRGAQSDARGVFPPSASLTQNSPNVAPQETDSEHNKDVNMDSKSESSRQGEQNSSTHSDRDVQSSTTTQQGGLRRFLGWWEKNVNL